MTKNFKTIKERLIDINADIGFVQFIIFHSGLEGSQTEYYAQSNSALASQEDKKFIKNKKDANYKKMKKICESQTGGQNKWKYIKEVLRCVRDTKIMKTALGDEKVIYPSNHKRGRSPEKSRADAAWFLRAYFKLLSGKFQMELIADIIERCCGSDMSYNHLNSWWQNIKKDYKMWDEQTFLESLQRQYNNMPEEERRKLKEEGEKKFSQDYS